MANKKPIKLDLDSVSGQTMLMEFQAGDTLPVETQVAILTDLVNRILVCQAKMGITPSDPILLSQLQCALQTTNN